MRYATIIANAAAVQVAVAAPSQLQRRGWGNGGKGSGGWGPGGRHGPPHYSGGGHGHGGHGGPNGNGGESIAEAKYRSEQVREAFQTAWDGYYKYAFPNDELLPLNNSFSNSRNGWGASAFDAIDTAIIMDKPDIVNIILDYIPTVDFSVSKDDELVSLFETTIRYLGGMLSAYDLLRGPYSDFSLDHPENVEKLLEQSQNLANYLSYAFDTPSGVPANNLDFGNRSTDGSSTNGLATIGTLVLEWQRLSDLTGNSTYGELAQKGESYLLNPQPSWAEPWPGLVGTNVDIDTGEFVDAIGGWNGGDDSFYEYLIKMYVYDSDRYSNYRDRWIVAADSTIENLASHPSSRPDLTFLANYENQTLIESQGHLTCFDSGAYILAGLVLDVQKYIDFGLELIHGCEATYNETLTGIGPEGWGWNNSEVPADQQAFFDRAGFYITDGHYLLRPEVVESFYYAYRVTGNRIYQDWSFNAFQNIVKYTRAGSGYAELVDVNAPNGGGHDNFQDSFWFAEVLKYTYIIHQMDSPIQVEDGGVNYFVYNTEAHPFKVAGPPH
ncbi:glycoside hydrolase family 47 protein [Polychaeton citri CBS 116435]|uniref:alpha-1,2-Mannosidase n=1 Tax=Polychaeton citri CBS 116435 TaxID=1314669 RepID=A0A9P4QFQ7_9PEZI|nr:glycoside hydrolase family 47 protein [Polychaeton citri CBS 116435]